VSAEPPSPERIATRERQAPALLRQIAAVAARTPKPGVDDPLAAREATTHCSA
jgi:hypothetical protein